MIEFSTAQNPKSWDTTDFHTIEFASDRDAKAAETLFSKLEADRDRWKRMYETVVVKDEGMQLYEEIATAPADTPTPRTDAAWKHHIFTEVGVDMSIALSCSRQLERELAAANARIEAWTLQTAWRR